MTNNTAVQIATDAPSAADNLLIQQTMADAARRSFAFGKSINRLDALYAAGVQVEGHGFVVPVAAMHLADSDIWKTLSQWTTHSALAGRFATCTTGAAVWQVVSTTIHPDKDASAWIVTDTSGLPVGCICVQIADGTTLRVTEQLWKADYAVTAIHQIAQAFATWVHNVLGVAQVEWQGAGVESCFVAERPFPGSSMILTAGPSIGQQEAVYALDAARHGWNNQWSKYLKQLEQYFIDYLGVKYAIATSSCTGALHLALLSLGIGKGDEVIVPDITWVATANAVVYAGATPVFADICEDGWGIDPASIERLITPKTKAIMPVHLYGLPAKMDQVMAIAKQHNLKVIEDAAPSIGAEFQGQKTGTFGDCAAFSFQGAKLVVTGEGGMLVMNDKATFEKAYSLWDQGRDLTKTFWINETGWKYKMSNVQAAIGMGQMQRVNELIAMKRRVFHWYEEGLAGVSHVRLCYELNDTRSIYWMTSLTLDEKAPITRDQLREALKARNVDTRPVFPAISQYPVWPVVQATQPTAKRIGAQSINLPSGVCLTREEVMYVCQAIREILQ